MAQGTRMGLAEATEIVGLAVASLRPGCERAEVAGSIRRRKVDVGDFEIVALPKFRLQPVDLFGERKVKVNELGEALAGPEWQIVKGGERYKQLVFRGHYKVDLYTPDPATWGVIFTLRTGSSDFAKWLVTKREKGGALPDNCYVQEGKLWRRREFGGYWIETPEEADFFREIGLRWIEPEERTKGRWWQWQKWAAQSDRPL